MRGIELTPSRPIDEVAELGAAAERSGFDLAVVASHYNNRDPFAALTRLAAATTDIRLGPGIVNPYETHPASLASRGATLQEQSDGRAVFGIGAGDRTTLANLGIERHRPLAHVEEAVNVIRRLWAGERVDHDGTFVCREAGLNYPTDPLPVYVGAQGPRMLRLAATIADGVLVNASHPKDLAWAAEQLRDGLADRPADRGELRTVASVAVSVGTDSADARDAARPPVAYIAAGAPRAVLDRHDLDESRAARIGQHIAVGEFDAAFAAVSPAMIDVFAAAGTTETVATRFEALLDHADAIVAGSPLGPDAGGAIDLIAQAFDTVEG